MPKHQASANEAWQVLCTSRGPSSRVENKLIPDDLADPQSLSSRNNPHSNSNLIRLQFCTSLLLRPSSCTRHIRISCAFFSDVNA
ncbi:hypothetical protein AcW2_007326 [Taiwanofungus camphoratus]|nr:hypothetical protein AcW2_007326 [Antrodia cinnamomea]